MTATKTPSRRSREAGTKDAATLAAQTVVLELRRSKPGFKRAVQPESIVDPDDDVARDQITVSKAVLDRKLLKAIRRCDGRIRRYLRGRAAVCSMLADGMSLIPLALVEDVDKAVIEYREERQRLVRELVYEKYAGAKAEAKKRLGKHYDEADYPEPEELERAFGVRARWLTFNVPAALESLNTELYERERLRVEAEWTTAGEEIRQALRESFAGLVEKMAERLGEDEDGKPKVFRASTVAQMQEFLSTFAARDLTGDEKLAALARKAQAVLAGRKPDELREDADARARVLKGMEQIKATLSTMEIVSPKARKFRADGEV